VTTDDLRKMLKLLKELKALQLLNEGLSSLQDEIQEKERGVEEFVKDCIGGSLYEYERKMKEAEAMVDKLGRRILELNNGLNDFDMEVR